MPSISSVNLFDLIKANQLPLKVQYAYEDHSDGRREYFCPNCELSQWDGYNLDHWLESCEGYSCKLKENKLIQWLRT